MANLRQGGHWLAKNPQNKLQHFSHPHPLVFKGDERMGHPCFGCREPVFGPSYSCIETTCRERKFYHHKLCAELPIVIDHPLHPVHPLILFDESTGYLEKENSKCKVCKEFRWEYSYCCYHCDFSLHIKCAVLKLEVKFHDHPLTPLCKSITFICDFCGKEGKGVPNLCSSCSFWIHNRCAYFPHKIMVVCHKHPLHLIHSSLELHQSNSQFCQICNKKVDTSYGLYDCFECDFVAHLDCAMNSKNTEDINSQELIDEDPKLDDSVDSTTLEVAHKRMELQHFSHPDHPLVFNGNERMGHPCYGCGEPVFGPSYSCIESRCKEMKFYHHKSCAELPLGLYHPLHPAHPLILFDETTCYLEKENSKCQVCKEFCWEYSYCCYSCDFNIHIKCAVLQLEAEFHDHPLTPICKSIMFTCNVCGKEDKGVPILCSSISCGFWIHNRCAYFPCKVKVVRHKHPLDLTYSSLKRHEFDSQFCQLCVKKVETHYGVYCCSKCDFVAHLDCAMDFRNREDINLLELKDEEELNKFPNSTSFEVKKSIVGEDGTQQAIEIIHFNHEPTEHYLQLTHEVLNDEKCDGCVQAILPPFYSCVKCRFFLHESCAKLPKTKKHPLHRHLLTLDSMKPGEHFFICDACHCRCNGFTYWCETCRYFALDVQCSLISDILTHPGHKHRLLLSSGNDSCQNCNCCDSETYSIFRCTNCELTVDFKCAALPHSTRYKQHEHNFILSYSPEDDSGEYYCDICEEKRNPKHWFYYCAECDYPAHPECILGKYPNLKFGDAYTFDCHPHPLTFTEKTKDHPLCNKCNISCEDLFHQCAQCNFYIHTICLLER